MRSARYRSVLIVGRLREELLQFWIRRDDLDLRLGDPLGHEFVPVLRGFLVRPEAEMKLLDPQGKVEDQRFQFAKLFVGHALIQPIEAAMATEELQADLIDIVDAAAAQFERLALALRSTREELEKLGETIRENSEPLKVLHADQ